MALLFADLNLNNSNVRYSRCNGQPVTVADYRAIDASRSSLEDFLWHAPLRPRGFPQRRRPITHLPFSEEVNNTLGEPNCMPRAPAPSRCHPCGPC